MKKFQMKKFILTMGLVAGSLVVAGAALAADSNTMTVSATVTGTCKFQSATSTLAFGAIDPSATSAKTASTTTTYRCNTGTTASVTRNDGANSVSAGTPRVKNSASADFMPYTLTLTGGTQVGTGHGAGQDKTLTIDGSIAVADFQNAPAGNYSDTITLTITP